MPWPIIAAVAGKVLGGALGGAAAGGAGGAAGGIGGALGGAAGGSGAAGGAASSAGNIMGMMGGGGGGGQQGGGGMMNGIMNIAKKPMNDMNENMEQVEGMLKAQNGAFLSPEFINYIAKTTGQGQSVGQMPQAPQVSQMQISPELSKPSGITTPELGAGMAPVQNQPTDTPAQNMAQPMPGAQPMPSIQNPTGANQQVSAPEMQSAVASPTNPTGAKANEAKSGGVMNPVGSILGTMSANNGKYKTDDRGVTQVTESSDIMGDAMGKAKKGDIVGAGLAIVSGQMNQMSQMRRQAREEAQWGSEMERQMKKSSAYNDPNSVYYAAKNGASVSAILSNIKKNNLSSMMEFPNRSV